MCVYSVRLIFFRIDTYKLDKNENIFVLEHWLLSLYTGNKLTKETCQFRDLKWHSIISITPVKLKRKWMSGCLYIVSMPGFQRQLKFIIVLLVGLQWASSCAWLLNKQLSNLRIAFYLSIYFLRKPWRIMLLYGMTTGVLPISSIEYLWQVFDDGAYKKPWQFIFVVLKVKFSKPCFQIFHYFMFADANEIINQRYTNTKMI